MIERGEAPAPADGDAARANARSQWFWLALRIGVTLGLLGVLATRLDLGAAAELVDAALLPTALLCLTLACVMVPLNAVRWALMLRLTGAHLPASEFLSITLVGHFFNQFLPTSVGGDVMRAWEATRSGVRSSDAIVSLVLDRVVGLTALLLLIIVGQPFLVWSIESKTVVLIATIAPVAALCGLTLIFFFDRLPPMDGRLRVVGHLAELTRVAKRLAAAPNVAAIALGCSLAMHGLALWATLLFARALGVPITIVEVLFVMPTVLLVSSLPVSISGWGVREAGLAAGFAALGYPPATAVLVSIFIGLSNAAVGLPGAVVWALRKRPVRSTGR